MNSKSKLTKSEWANGQPSVEIAPYECSPRGFNRVLEALSNYFMTPVPAVISRDDKFMSTMTLKNETVEIDMDNQTCSLAFRSKELRDEVFTLLKNAAK